MDEFNYELAEDETEEEAMVDFYHYTLELHKDHGNYGSLSFETCTNGMCVMAREWKAQVDAAQHSAPQVTQTVSPLTCKGCHEYNKITRWLRRKFRGV